jgi:hypothetical protein
MHAETTQIAIESRFSRNSPVHRAARAWMKARRLAEFFDELWNADCGALVRAHRIGPIVHPSIKATAAAPRGLMEQPQPPAPSTAARADEERPIAAVREVAMRDAHGEGLASEDDVDAGRSRNDFASRPHRRHRDRGQIVPEHSHGNLCLTLSAQSGQIGDRRAPPFRRVVPSSAEDSPAGRAGQI